MMSDAQLAAEVVNAEIDDLLILWHNHVMHGGIVRKCRSSSAGSYYTTSRQYDDVNGALDAALDTRKVDAVEFAVSEMVDPYRAAIHMQAKALTLGIDAFLSPRLPSDPGERAVILKTARRMLCHNLARAGVVDFSYESMI